MPKVKNVKFSLNLDLLKPQSNPDKVLTRFLRWLLSSGRFIFIIVEGVVLLAFIARFKLDADLTSSKEKIAEQIPYIEHLADFEKLARLTQLKLSTISSLRSSDTDFTQVLKKISDQVPQGVKISSLNLDRNVGKLNLQLNAVALSDKDLASLLVGLKGDSSFSGINIANISYEKGSISFTINGQADLSGQKNL